MPGHSAVRFKPTQTHRNVSSCAPRGRACVHVRTRRIIWMTITPVLCVCVETRQLFTNCEMKSKRVKGRILVTAQKAILINLRRVLQLTKQIWNI